MLFLVISTNFSVSLGVTVWKGDNLYSGYSFKIGNKEVELDNPVSASDLPPVRGAAASLEDDRALETPPPIPGYLLQAISRKNDVSLHPIPVAAKPASG